MRKFIVFLVFCLFMFKGVFAYAEPSEDEAKKAFLVTFRVFVDCAMKSAFGALPDGVTGEGMNMAFSGVAIPPLKIKDSAPYQRVFGKITVKNKNDIHAELNLSGGIVENLSWVVKNFDMKNKSHTADVIADGGKFVCEVK